MVYAIQLWAIFFVMDNTMNKRPSLQFYPADWIKDPDLQMCSMNTIGIWINLLCRMWEAKEEGVLCGKSGELALLVGARPAEFNRFLRETETHSFADVTNSNGVVTVKCKRMNKLFLEREGAKRRMQKYRKEQGNADVATSSSTSSSSSLHTYTLERVKSEAVLVGITEQQAEEWHNHYAAQGFVFGGGLPITNLKAALVRWKNNQYKFVEKKDVRTSKDGQPLDETYIR